MRKKKKCPFTKEELIEILQIRRDELGKKPTRKDIPETIMPYYRATFGKWCYALEAAGIVIPSQATLDRRMRHKMRHRRGNAQRD